MCIIENLEMLDRVTKDCGIDISELPDSFVSAILRTGNERALRDFCCGRSISVSEVFGFSNGATGWISPFPTNEEGLMKSFFNDEMNNKQILFVF